MKQNPYRYNDIIKYYVGTVDVKENFNSKKECEDYSLAKLEVERILKSEHIRCAIIKSTTKFESVD